MAVYFVIGAAIVVWALILSFGGMARVKDFPDRRGGRLLMIVSATLCLAGFVALLATTEKEHPKEEAQAEAAEKAQEKENPAGAEVKGVLIPTAEAEYSIKLANGTKQQAGTSTFVVKNEGKIQHDLAVEGPGGEKKTPLIGPGKRASLTVDLETGRYKLYCTVPGHEQLGMKTEVTVR